MAEHTAAGAAPARRSSTDLLDQVADDVRGRVAAVARRHGFSLDAWHVLDVLATAGPQPMRALAERARVTGPTLTRVVDRLAESALVYRNVDSADRRRVLVHASSRGLARHREVAPLVAELEHRVLAPLSAPEQRLLRDLLERLSPATG